MEVLVNVLTWKHCKAFKENSKIKEPKLGDAQQLLPNTKTTVCVGERESEKCLGIRVQKY